jgi:hypothetical protein
VKHVPLVVRLHRDDPCRVQCACVVRLTAGSGVKCRGLKLNRRLAVDLAAINDNGRKLGQI